MINRRFVRILIYLLFLPIFLGAGFTGGVLVDHFLITPTIVSAKTPVQSSSGLDLINQAYQIIQQNYVDRSAVQQTQLEYGAISGMVDSLGDTGHSRFLTPRWYSKKTTSLKAHLRALGLK